MLRYPHVLIGCRLPAGLAAGLLLSATVASAVATTWDFDLQTYGQDVFWASPTAVCTIADEYDCFYEVTLVEIEVSYLGIPFGPFDITDQVPPEDLTGSDTFPGPPPFTIYDDVVVYPEPPEPPSLQAHVFIGVDANGYGQLAVQDVYLGTVEYDLGWPFGVVEVQIESVRIAGYVQVTPRLIGDINGDGAVDLGDLGILLSNYGITQGALPEQGDLNGDGAVNLSDLGMLLANYGLSC
jgi:hypothetical protein